jgi:hypothetical protein
MTQPQRNEVKATDLPRTDWDEVRRRRERTENLIERMKDAQNRLEKAVDRVISKTTK